MKILFSYIAQPHQTFHSLPIAAEIALRFTDVKVHVACSSDAQERVARKIAAAYPGAPLIFERLRAPWFARLPTAFGRSSVPLKLAVLRANRSYFAQFDAVVVPERTSLYLKSHLGLSNLPLIWTSHGAGDRAISYASFIRDFDFVLLGGIKQEQRMLAEGTVRPGAYHLGCYAKFDAVERLASTRRPLFNNGRPTVLYNPHFRPKLSSWPRHGFEVLDFFASSERYNLIFAPHVRLFDPPRPRSYRRFKPYLNLPHLRIDLGSERSFDMSYTLDADLYLGDVSSQVVEFLLNPRPCVFLNSHHVAWRDNPDYLFWNLGPVIDAPGELEAALQRAIAEQPEREAAQIAYFNSTFTRPFGMSSAAAAAIAIIDYLRLRG